MEESNTNEIITKASDPMEAKGAYSKFGSAYLGAALLNVIFAVLVLVLAMKVSPDLGKNTTFRFLVSIVTLYAFGLPFAYMQVKDLPKCEIGHRKMNIGEIISSLLIGYALIVCSNIVGITINVYFGKLTGKGAMNPIADAITGLNPIASILVVSILAPIVEELVFRKILVDRLYKYGEWFTILFSGMMFGLFHGNFAQFFYAFTIGMYLAYIYMRTGKIRYTIYIHIFINGIGSLAAMALGDIDIDIVQGYLYSGQVAEYMDYVSQHFNAFLLLGLYGILVLIVSLVGFILAIVFHNKFHIETIDTELPKGTGIRSIFGNPGMCAYILFFVVAIVLAQFGTSLSAVIIKLFM